VAVPKIPDWAKQVSWTVGIVAAMFGVAFMVFLPAKIDSQMQPLALKVAGIETGIGELKSRADKNEGTVDGLLKDLVSGVLEQLKHLGQAHVGEAKKTLGLANTATAAALQAGVKIDSSLVFEAGRDALLSTNNDDLAALAWAASQQLTNYASFLRANMMPVLGSSQRPKTGRFALAAPIDNRGRPIKNPDITTFGFATADKAALFEHIGPIPAVGLPPELNPIVHPEQGNAEYAVVDFLGQTVILDGMRLRNIILKNSHLTYTGKLIDLNNVYFVGCTFTFPNDLRGQQFAKALFETSTTFGAS
jgi:hypothetical protein